MFKRAPGRHSAVESPEGAAPSRRRRTTRIAAIVAAVALLGGSLLAAGPAFAVGRWTSTLSSVGTQPVPTGNALEYSYQVQCSEPTGCGTITAHIPAPVGWTAAAGAPSVNIPSNVTGVTYTANANGSLDVTWVNPPPGQSNQVQLNWPTVTVTTAPGDQPITATVTDGTTTQTPSATDSLSASPNLAITKSAPSTIAAGSNLTYSINATNTPLNPNNAQGVLATTNTVVTDPLPAGVTYVSCALGSAPQGTTCSYNAGTRTVTFSIPGNFYSDGFNGSVTVNVPAGTSNGTSINNVATITGTPIGSTPVTANDNAITTVGAGVIKGQQSKSGPTVVQPGQLYTYALTIQNTGTTDASAVVNDTPLPTNIFNLLNVTAFNTQGGQDFSGNVVAKVTYSDGTTASIPVTHYQQVLNKAGVTITGVSFAIGTLAAGGNYNLQITGTVPANAPTGATGTNCMSSTMTANGNTYTVPSTPCVTTTVAPHVFNTTFYKSLAVNSPAAPGGTLTWNLLTYNDPQSQNLSPLQPYYLDLLPSNLSYVDGSFGFSLAGSSSAAACPATSAFGVTVVPNYIDGRTAVIATTQANPGAVAGTTVNGGSGALMANNNSYCTYTIQTTVNPGTAAGTYTGTTAGAVGDSTYPVSPSYQGNSAYLYATNNGGFSPTAQPGRALPDSSDINKDGNTSQGVESATSDFQVSHSAALEVVKQVKGDKDSDWIGSAEQNPSDFGHSTPGGTVDWQVTLGDNGNEPETNLVAYDLLPDASNGGTNTGVTSVRYGDTSAAGYDNQWIPTLTGPITVPAGDPVTIQYSTNPNPCRPEMSNPGNTVAAVYCGGNYQANSDWKTAAQVTDWSKVRAIRFDYGDAVIQPITSTSPTCGTPASGCFTYSFTMAVPTTNADGTPFALGTEPYTWNKVAAQADSVNGTATNPLLPTEAPWVKDVVEVPAATTPALDTTVSTQTPKVGDTLTDSIVVSGAGSAAATGTWKLLGPVAAGADGTCAAVDWTNAPTFDTGGFSITGNGTYTTAASKALAVAGCYTYVDSLPATGTTTAVTTDAGIPAETALVKPTIATTISKTVATAGDTLSDSVTVAGVGTGSSYTGSIGWQLLGPVAAVAGSCDTVDWTGAAVFDSGSVPVSKDGSYTTTSNKALAAAGCYTFVDTLSANGSVPQLATAAGLKSETALVGLAAPSVTTTVSTQQAGIGASISDTVNVTGAAGSSVTGTWTLYGPVAAVSGKCDAVDWTGAAVADSGPFTVQLTNGSGSTTTDSTVVDDAGCYTYTESLDATAATSATAESAKGVASETVLIAQNTPTVSTTVSAAQPSIGSTLNDSVTVTGTNGETIPGTWKILGPVTPAGGSCAAVDWSSAPTFDSGTFTVTGDGTFQVGASKTVTTAGCYTYVDSLAATDNTSAVTGLPGVQSETAQVVDFAVGDYVWKDANHNGIQDEGEQPVPNVTVTLLDSSGKPIATTTTDSTGYYHFDNLPAGTYSVKFSDLPAGTSLTTQSSTGSTQLNDSNPDTSTGVTPQFTLGVGVGNTTPTLPTDTDVTAPFIDRTIDAGIIDQPVAVGDYVWIDSNKNGIQDANETPLPGTTVELLTSTGQPALDYNGQPVQPTTTDANGHYVFDNLAPGQYEVKFTLPPGYTFTTQSSIGSNSANDSNPDVTSGVTPVFTVAAGNSDTRLVLPSDKTTKATLINPTIDAGVLPPVYAVGDYVWFDQNHNGIQDSGESPVPGVTVTLQNPDGTPAVDANGTVIPPTTTDANGHYVFDNVPAGNYKVAFSNLPAGYEFTTQSSNGSTQANDSNPNGTGVTPVFEVGADAANMRPVVGSDGTKFAYLINPTIDAGIVKAPVPPAAPKPPAPKPLADTGSDVFGPALAASVLAGLGLLLLIAAAWRRRRRQA